MLKEFKQFAMRGNVLDLAVGVIIGGAFGKIVTSLVNDIIMPPVGLLLGKNANFTDYFISLNGQKYASLAEAKEAGAATINYGLFINTVLDFLIVAFAIFLVVRNVNKLRERMEKPAQPKAAETKPCPECLSDIPIKATRCKFCTTKLAGEGGDGPAVTIR